MSKVNEIRSALMKMRIGDSVRFPTNKTNQFLEIDRVFKGRNQGWVVYVEGERHVTHDLNEVVQVILKHWNPNLKKVMDQRFSELDEIIDLGNY